MRFNFRLLFRLLGLSIFRHKGSNLRLVGKRIRFLLVLFTAYPALVMFTYLCLFFDRVFYRGFLRKQPERPLFILGNYRSGTTFMHRLLAMDEESFSSMQTWEIYFGVSIIQRKAIRGVIALDEMLGGHLARKFKEAEEAMFSQVTMHRIRFGEPEEDEGIFMYLAACVFFYMLFPVADIEPEARSFNTTPTREQRIGLMHFYYGAVQRHMYAHPRSRHYLSKNPANSPRLADILRRFPDARIVYMARRPEDMLPSNLRWMAFAMHVVAAPRRDIPFREDLIELAARWYEEPLALIDQMRSHQVAIVRYDDLVDNPMRVVDSLYERFGYEITEAAREKMRIASEHAAGHRSSRVRLEHLGVSRSYVRRRFNWIYNRLDFARPPIVEQLKSRDQA